MYMPLVKFAYNNSYFSSIQMTPFEYMEENIDHFYAG